MHPHLSHREPPRRQPRDRRAPSGGAASVRAARRGGGYTHGFRRASDPGSKSAVVTAPSHVAAAETAAAPRRSGVPLLMFLALAIITATAVTRVHTRTRVLEAGARITELTAEHARLLDQKRRLEAERAYLRHPDHIQEVALELRGMIPAAAERVQTITLRGPPPPPGHDQEVSP